jgi:hypothetical protein
MNTDSGNPFRPVSRGDPLRLSSRVYNRMARAVAPSVSPPGDGIEGASGGRHTVIVSNKSGVDCERYFVVGLESAAIPYSQNPDEFLRLPVVDGGFPDDELPFGVLIECIPDQMAGSAVVVGAVQVKLHVINEAHGFALVESGQMGWLKTGATGPAQIVWKEPVEVRADPNYAWAIVILGGGGSAGLVVFPVTVTIDGGSAGTVSTTCSYTYEVKALDGSVIGTGKTPEVRRYPNVPYTTTPANSPGLAYVDADGVLHLFDANELPETEDPCEGAPEGGGGGGLTQPQIMARGLGA